MGLFGRLKEPVFLKDGSNAGNASYGCSKFPACRGVVPIRS